jgi:nucleoside-diphosphate-sugar epimerase
MNHERILVTGANGFIGRHLCRRLADDGIQVSACVRSGADLSTLPRAPEISIHETAPLGPDTDWSPALRRVDTVIHLAARVHVMRETAADPLGEFHRVNVRGTEHLASMAAAHGVRRFIFVSSLNGSAAGDAVYRADDQPSDCNLYGSSKWEAEERLGEVAAATGMECVVIRAPLVYGPGVKGNFLSLLKCLSKGFPLPFASIRNKRSLLNVDNLTDLLCRAIHHPAAPGNRFLVKDAEDLSTVDLVRRLGRALHVEPRLFPFPPAILLAGGKLLGRERAVQRLCSSLVVDTQKTQELLGWTPPFSIDSGLTATAQWFQNAMMGSRS